MPRTTEIEWTEHTWNPFVGCSIKSAGCKNCYAMKMARRIESFGTKSYQGLTKTINNNVIWTGKLSRSSDNVMSKPFKIKNKSLIFVNSMSDFFHESADDSWRIEAIEIMAATQHIYQILTKRPNNILSFINRTKIKFPDNVWIGATVESNNVTDRIKILQSIPSSIKFLSIEPFIGKINLSALDNIDWIIIGGESGPKCRHCNPEWIRLIRDICIAKSIPLFFKQWGHHKNNPLIQHCPSNCNPIHWLKNIDKIGKGGSIIDNWHWKQYPSIYSNGGFARKVLPSSNNDINIDRLNFH